MLMRSIVSYFFIESVCPLEGGDNHLAEHRFLLLEISELFLEVVILLFLGYHAQLQSSVQRLHKRRCGLRDLLVYILDFGPHGVQLLTEELDQLVVLLQVLVCLSG